MKAISRLAATLVLAAVIVGCDQSPTGTALEADPIALALTVDEDSGARRVPVVAHDPVLNKIFHAAIRKLRASEGPDAARAILAEISELTRAAAVARAAGDLEEARRLVGEIHLIKAEVSVRVFGADVVDRVLAVVETRLDMMQKRIRALEARGQPVPPRLKEIIAEAEALVATANDELAAGNPAEALVLATRAFDLVVIHRHLGRQD